MTKRELDLMLWKLLGTGKDEGIRYYYHELMKRNSRRQLYVTKPEIGV